MNQRRLRTGPRTGITLAIVLCAFAVICGFFSAGTMDAGRALGLNAPDWESPIGGPVQILPGFFLGLLGSIFLGIIFSEWIKRRDESMHVVITFGVIAAGWTLGTLIFTPWYSTPQNIGHNIWASSLHSEAWGLREWVYYASPVWLPLVGAIVTAICVLILMRKRKAVANAILGAAETGAERSR